MGQTTLVNSIGEDQDVFLDSAILIYFFEGIEKYKESLFGLLDLLSSKRKKAYISTIALSELLVMPYKKGDFDSARAWTEILKFSDQFELISVNPRIAIDTAYVRANYGFKTPDSLHIATAMQAESPVFITNDKKLKKFEEMTVLCLDDFV
jgi:predicted nucleic acid-binding protein